MLFVSKNSWFQPGLHSFKESEFLGGVGFLRTLEVSPIQSFFTLYS